MRRHHHNPISFDYECWSPNIDVEVLANEDGTGILIIDKLTDDEIELETLCELDRKNIKALVRAEAAEVVRFHKERHPANDEFGIEYINWLNRRDMSGQRN